MALGMFLFLVVLDVVWFIAFELGWDFYITCLRNLLLRKLVE